MLINGAHGTGKTASAIATLAAIRDPITAWITEPTLDKASDQRPHLLDEIEQFFAHYVGAQGPRVRRHGPGRAGA